MTRENDGLYDRDASDDPFIEEYVSARELAFTEPTVAIKHMEDLAFRGSMMAILYVADAMQTGWIYGRKYPEKAEGWYKVAAEAGSRRALHELGRTQRDRGDFAAAVSSISAAILANYPPAMNSLAIMKYRGIGLAKDRDGARTLWKRAASLGHYPSSTNLANAYMRGKFGVWRAPLCLTEFARSLFLRVTSKRYSDRRR